MTTRFKRAQARSMLNRASAITTRRPASPVTWEGETIAETDIVASLIMDAKSLADGPASRRNNSLRAPVEECYGGLAGNGSKPFQTPHRNRAQSAIQPSGSHRLLRA